MSNTLRGNIYFAYAVLFSILNQLSGQQSNGQLRLMAFEQEELWGSANERIPWHEKLDSEEAIQNRVHELVFFSISCYSEFCCVKFIVFDENPFLK